MEGIEIIDKSAGILEAFMVKWYGRLFIGDSLTITYEKYVEEINNADKARGIYLILLSANDSDVFDIVKADELRKPFYKGGTFRAVGIAKGREEAQVLAGRMLAGFYKANGSLNIKDYLVSNFDRK